MFCTIGNRANDGIIENLEDFQKNGIEQLRNKSYSKGKEKHEDKKHFKNNLDTIEDPQNNHTIQDQGGSWAIPLKKMFGRDVFMGVK